jgi:hypothetical protein
MRRLTRSSKNRVDSLPSVFYESAYCPQEESPMPALTPEFAKVDAQLGLLRKRLNLRRIADAACLSGALAAAALSVLISSAVHATPVRFSYTMWAIILLISTTTAIAMTLVRRKWLSLDQTARIADQQAQLEDRLSTLIAQRPSLEQPSRMPAVLLAQVLSLTQRWDPRTLVPVQVPRSIYVCAAGLALLAATVLLERRQLDEPAHVASQSAPTPNVEKPAETAAARILSPDGEPDPARHRAAGRPGTANDASGVLASPESHDLGADRPGNQHAPTGGASSRADHGNPVSSRFQTLIRQALGTEPAARPDHATTDFAQKNETARGAGAARDSAQQSVGNTNGRNGSGQTQSESSGKGDAGRDRNRDAHNSNRREDTDKNSPQPGFASGAGAAAGAAPFAPPGTGETAGKASPALRTFTIKLTETSRVAYTTLEDQPENTGQQIPLAAGDALLPREQRLDSQSSEQRGLHRTTIPSEYETTVRRIFSHRADGE